MIEADTEHRDAETEDTESSTAKPWVQPKRRTNQRMNIKKHTPPKRITKPQKVAPAQKIARKGPPARRRTTRMPTKMEWTVEPVEKTTTETEDEETTTTENSTTMWTEEFSLSTEESSNEHSPTEETTKVQPEIIDSFTKTVSWFPKGFKCQFEF